jgi:gliding motility associated protien GldN
MKKLFGYFVLALVMAGLAKSVDGQVLDSPPRDGVYDKKVTIEKKPITYPWVREADVGWRKWIWRVIDLRENLNQPFYYPEVPHNDLRSLVQVILDALKEGTITAYDASSTTDEFLVPLTYQEIMNRLERTDSATMQRPYPPYDWYDTVISVKFNPSDVKRFRIKEDWFFDKQRSVMEVRIWASVLYVITMMKKDCSGLMILCSGSSSRKPGLFWQKPRFLTETTVLPGKPMTISSGNGCSPVISTRRTTFTIAGYQTMLPASMR